MTIRQNQDPALRMAREEGIVIGHHHQQHGQGEIGVVQASAACPPRQSAGSGVSPLNNAATILRWLGMITMNTLAAINGADENADMDEGAPAGEDMGEAIGSNARSAADTSDQATRDARMARWRAKFVIDDPAADDRLPAKCRWLAMASAA